MSAVPAAAFLVRQSEGAAFISKEAVMLHWLLRVSVLACFVGHGAFGIITKADWLPFFAVVGISPEVGYKLMPLIGMMDISIGIITFLRPMKAVLVYAIFWCTLTALMRPAAGMSFSEFLERSGNYGIPLVLLLSACAAGVGLKSWFSRMEPRPLSPELARRLVLVLVTVTSLLLAGHGWFGAVLGKDMLAQHYASIGLGGTNGIWLVHIIGCLELVAAAAIFFFPTRGFFAAIAVWKLATEMLYPISGAPFWETVERGGSYAAPLAAVILLTWYRKAAPAPNSSAALSDTNTDRHVASGIS